MAKTFTSVVGLDIGRYSLKSVVMQKKGPRFVVSNFAQHILDETAERTPERLAQDIKALMKQLGGGAKACAVAISHPDALIRLIDQPDTPTDVLRDALKLNGMMLLNQDCRDYVLDCALVPTVSPVEAVGGSAQKRYLVGGLPRKQVADLGAALDGGGAPGIAHIQLSPVAVFNAFEFAQKEVFDNHAFFLLDFGHNSSTMLVGSKRELVLIRNVEFGGKALVETLQSLSGENRSMVLQALAQEDEVMVENARMALAAMTREIGSSIGFFEGRREETIGQVWVSGGTAKNKTILRVLSEELHMPCLAWNATERCEINVSSSKRARFTEEMLDLSVACGAAAEALNQA